MNQFGMYKRACSRKAVHTQKKHTKKQKMQKKTTSCSHTCTSSREGDHTAGCAVARLPLLCVYHSETNGLQAAVLLNESWGGQRGHLSAQFYYNLLPPPHVHKQAHTERKEKGGALGPPDRNIPLRVSGGVAALSSCEYKKKGKLGAIFFIVSIMHK